MDKPLTLLLHGLHMNRWCLKPLEKRLSLANFPTYRYQYPTLKNTIEQHSQGLHQWLTKHHDPTKPINLVGHSLGGLVIRHFLVNHPNWLIHRCVTLGTPHRGSVCANYTHRYFRLLIQHAYANALDGNCPPLPKHICMGVIAGSRPLGLGLPLIHYHNRKHRLTDKDRQHDGTVYVSESRLDNACDYLILPVSHSSLLVDPVAASQTIHFLEHGQFAHQFHENT